LVDWKDFVLSFPLFSATHEIPHKTFTAHSGRDSPGPELPGLLLFLMTN
jgi:hypothetical protein